MYFDFSEDQTLLQSTLRDFLRGECTPDLLRSLWESETGRSQALWGKLAELGAVGLLVPESYEGMGLDEIDLTLLLLEAGRAALPEALISTAAVAVPLLVAQPSAELRERWLKPIAVGEAIVAVGHEVNPFVSDAHVASLLLLQHADEIHAVPGEEARLTAQPANDPSRRLFQVEWTPRAETRVAQGDQGRALAAAALDRGAWACAAQLLGVCEQLLDLAVAYAGQRQQFGKPIGSFQAIKHLMADVKVKLEYARPLVYRAAHSLARLAEDDATRSLHVSMAKLAAGEAASSAARVALQVHGAIGYTWEQDLHIWMRRAWSLELAWGDRALHRVRVADAVLADGARLGPGTTFRGDD